MSCIVLTTDFSPESRRAFAPALALAAQLGHDVILLAVMEDVPFEVVAGGGLAAVYPDRTQLRADQERKLAEMAAELQQQAKDVNVRSHLQDATDVARAIADYAQQQQAAYVALASHGRSGLRRLLLGSVAEALLRHSHVPVIVYPPPPPEAA
jgi:nucleotide-binding universal stress UspA family protein